MAKNKKIIVDGAEITILNKKEHDFISLTDMAKSQMQDAIIIKWMSLKSTIEYLGEWEALYNPEFNYNEFGSIKNAAGIHQGLEQSERLKQLNQIAITQMKSLGVNKQIKKLK